MGIRGLTTFIEGQSHLYLQDFNLHDCGLIIDGYAIACQLYRWHCKDCNDCFGGDYDRYARSVRNFFQLLTQCKVVPYVVFDGGYEHRKLKTVMLRLKNKIQSASRLNSTTEGTVSVFPLFMRECFEEIVRILNLKSIRCDFEGDSEIARIASTLNCPVLSYDSDFFIFDITYIPFNTFNFKSKISSDSHRFIPCKMFNVEKFLRAYGGMDKNNLPLLAALLGNDYVKRRVFSMFYRNLKRQTSQQKRIKAVITWLKHESKESATEKILNRYRFENRKKLKRKLWNAVKGYSLVESKYLSYLGFNKESEKCTIIENNEDVESSSSDDEKSEDLNENSSGDESIISIDDVKTNNRIIINEKFLDKYRRCQYPAYFIDILLKNRYFCAPQVENVTLQNSHVVSYDILTAIHKILTNSKQYLVCYTRAKGCTKLCKERVPNRHKLTLPTYEEMLESNVKYKKELLLKIIHVSDENFVNNFPKSWHIFLLSLKYAVDKNVLNHSLLFSLILCKIFLEYCDKKAIKKVKTSSLPFENLRTLNQDETSKVVNSLKKYFEMDEKLTDRFNSFDRNLVHLISEFQSVFMHLSHLNRLLDKPFDDINISETLNCTFLYNFTTNLSKRSDMCEYTKILLKETPTFLEIFETIMGRIGEFVNEDKLRKEKAVPKRRRKKKKFNNIEEEDKINDMLMETSSDAEQFLYDPNNKFCILGIN